MLTGRFLGALLAVLPALSLADVTAPDAPAGRALGMWLDAFNSGDRAREESFIKTYASWMNLDGSMKWRAETGGYDLLDIYSNDQTTVFFRVKAKENAAEEIGRVSVNTTEPLAVIELGTWRIPPGTKLDVVALDAPTRTKVIAAVAGWVDHFYVIPETATKMSAALRKHEARGQYRTLIYGPDLARRLTADLREISHDKHMEVRFSFVAQPEGSPTKTSAAESKRLAAINCGFPKADHLPPNIGYLKFDGFADPEICAPTASAAMNFLADSDALILDLRDNHGGRGLMAEFIASYLFDERTHLIDVSGRQEKTTQESWTLAYVPGKKFIGKPVFILTSNQTFSAAEAFSYALKDLKRATLIGETTGGGAHLVEPKRIDDHFSVIVSTGRPISPITKGNWEGTGIEPDVKVAAAEALDVAQKLATEEISKNSSNLSPTKP
jgi:hypothetical protein